MQKSKPAGAIESSPRVQRRGLILMPLKGALRYDKNVQLSFYDSRPQAKLYGMTLRFSGILLLFCLMVFSRGSTVAEDSKIQYELQVQPIFAEHCTRCHGADQATREAGLRLDDRESALSGGDSGHGAIVPGEPAASLLIERITSSDESTVMPPPDERKPLSEPQIELLTKWIQQGATYTEHWSFTPPQSRDLQSLSSQFETELHPIDLIVRSKLKQWGMSPAGPAPSSVLCRRLYLDLIGLPPSPQQLTDFEQAGMEATIELLLDSQRYGEKWARPWMDVARYSDTNGYEKDLRRDQWVWRDWVIDALNQDKPYNEFVIEQIAGDLMDEPTQDQMIATGFLRNSMINEEGAIVPEQFRMVEMFDRMDCIGKAILGLTTQCAQCHSHKFDPLSQREYYGMFAFLNNAYEAQSWVYNSQQQQQLSEFQKQLADLNQAVLQAHPDSPALIRDWEKSILQSQPEWTHVTMSEFGSVSGLNHPVQIVDQSILMLGHVSPDVFFISEPAELSGVTGVRLEALTHPSLPVRGPARKETSVWGVAEFEVHAELPGESDVEPTWSKIALVKATADWSNSEQKDEKTKRITGPVSLMIDGSDDTSWQADRGLGRRGQASVAVLQFQQPLDLPSGTRLKFVLRTGREGMLGCCRISLTRSTDPERPRSIMLRCWRCKSQPINDPLPNKRRSSTPGGARCRSGSRSQTSTMRFGSAIRPR